MVFVDSIDDLFNALPGQIDHHQEAAIFNVLIKLFQLSIADTAAYHAGYQGPDTSTSQ